MTQSFSTKAIHEGEGTDNTTGAHNTPIYQTATFSFERAEDFAAAIELAVDPDRMNPLDSFFYSRTGNPTNAALEAKLAALESAETALVTSSGMSAVAISIMISAKSGDHVLVTNDLFVISRQFFEQDCPAMGIEVSMFDVRDIDQARAAVKPNSTAIFLETVTTRISTLQISLLTENWLMNTGSRSSQTIRFSARIFADLSSRERTSFCTPQPSTSVVTAIRLPAYSQAHGILSTVPA